MCLMKIMKSFMAFEFGYEWVDSCYSCATLAAKKRFVAKF